MACVALPRLEGAALSAPKPSLGDSLEKEKEKAKKMY
jgi:hypothetical protein